MFRREITESRVSIEDDGGISVGSLLRRPLETRELDEEQDVGQNRRRYLCGRWALGLLLLFSG